MKDIIDIIEIAKVSEYLSTVDIQRKALYGGGIDMRLPIKINNIRKSVEWLNDHNPVYQHTSNAYVFFDSVGDVGDTITIKINNGEYGIVTLGTYEIQPSDTDVSTLIQSLVAYFPVGIVILSYIEPYTLRIRSNFDNPASLNGDNLIIEAETTYYSIQQFAGGIDPSNKNQELRNMANYLYALCAPYNNKAASIIGIIEPNTNARPIIIGTITSPIRVTNNNFIDATHWAGANSVGQVVLPSYKLQVFANFIARYLTEGTEWERTSAGINILLDGFDALTNDYEFYIDISA